MDLINEYSSNSENSNSPTKSIKSINSNYYTQSNKNLIISKSSSDVFEANKILYDQTKLTNAKSNIKNNPDINISNINCLNVYNEFSANTYLNDNLHEKKLLTGTAYEEIFNQNQFNQQMYNYNSLGYAINPQSNSNNNILMNENNEKSLCLFKSKINDKESDINESNIDKSFMNKLIKTKKDYGKILKERRIKYGDPCSGDFQGPWAGYKGEEKLKNINEISEDQKEVLKQLEINRKKKLEEEEHLNNSKINFEPVVVNHLNYKVSEDRSDSFLNPPSYIKQSSHTCYIPKKLYHKYTGHSKAVYKIKFFPKVGHFLLSCSLDCKIKLWDVNKHKKCVYTYLGHTEAVRDVSFSYDGKHFVSAGFDKLIHYWDTETGKVITTFANKKLPFCCTMYPTEDNYSNNFLVGTSSKSILQYDTRSKQLVQSYDEHLGGINSITFVDNNKKFISSSDDKKLFVWEFGVPMVIKHISDPTMYSVPTTALHPSGKSLAGQSLGNKILVFDSKSGYKLNRHKKFKGHMTAGYSCGIDISPDGQFLVSGDSEGGMWFWDWESNKNYRVIPAHDKVCVDVKWHPIEPSKIASCSWDGSIKLWD